jgi:crossover junction endodeoxyribonuclease RusA
MSGVRAPDFACTVTGDPAPQGSKRHVGNGVMVESSARLPDWRTAVALQVRSAMRKDKFAGFERYRPVRMVLTYRLRRPVNAKRLTRQTRRPDLDKLLRATMDALVICGLLADDAQAYDLHPVKVFAADGEDLGCTILAWEELP